VSALWGGWSAKLEYLYIDLGKTGQTVTATTPANLAGVGIPGVGTVLTANANQTFRTTDSIVRVGELQVGQLLIAERDHQVCRLQVKWVLNVLMSHLFYPICL
jgi:hypothetical protein